MAYVKKNWQNTPSTNTPLNADNLNHMEQGIYDAAATADYAKDKVDDLQGLVYSPLVAATAAAMTDTTKVYVYTGSEAGYTSGHWYYYNGSAWADGGVYNSTAFNTDTTLSHPGEAADAEATGNKIGELKSALTPLENDTYLNKSNDISKYLYMKNSYINSSGVIGTLEGCDIYAFPVNLGDVLYAEWDKTDPYYGSIAEAYCFMKKDYQDNFSVITRNNGTSYGIFLTSEGYVLAIADEDGHGYTWYTNVMQNKANTLSIKYNYQSRELETLRKNPFFVNAKNTEIYLKNRYHLYASTDKMSIIASPYYATALYLKKGDVIQLAGRIDTLSVKGTYRYYDTSDVENISYADNFHVMEKDGYVFLFGKTDEAHASIVYPSDMYEISAKQIFDGNESEYVGKSAVAFGTSLTYRAKSTGGYLQYLPILSQTTFDNQGVGSSYIYGASGSTNMLEKIKSYASYSGKDLVIVEGFVNDWYNSHVLGTWKDTAETSVCGCVRSALNYIRTQNADATVYLILDHYGQSYGGEDFSSTVVKNAYTQYEYYEEIAKVAESLGVHVIKLYADSEIGELTPQYFHDYIHPNTLGAKQTAHIIWSVLREWCLNLQQ